MRRVHCQLLFLVLATIPAGCAGDGKQDDTGDGSVTIPTGAGHVVPPVASLSADHVSGEPEWLELPDWW